MCQTLLKSQETGEGFAIVGFSNIEATGEISKRETRREKYNKASVWSLSWVTGTELLNPWYFPNDLSVFVIHEPPRITSEFMLTTWIQKGAGYQKDLDL